MTYTYTHVTSATTTTVNTSAGILGGIAVNTYVASATIKVYNGPSASSPEIAAITLPSTITGVFPFETLRNIALTSSTVTVVTSGATDITIKTV